MVTYVTSLFPLFSDVGADCESFYPNEQNQENNDKQSFVHCCIFVMIDCFLYSFLAFTEPLFPTELPNAQLSAVCWVRFSLFADWSFLLRSTKLRPSLNLCPKTYYYATILGSECSYPKDWLGWPTLTYRMRFVRQREAFSWDSWCPVR